MYGKKENPKHFNNFYKMSRPDDGIKVLYLSNYVRRRNPFNLEATESFQG